MTPAQESLRQVLLGGIPREGSAILGDDSVLLLLTTLQWDKI